MDGWKGRNKETSQGWQILVPGSWDFLTFQAKCGLGFSLHSPHWPGSFSRGTTGQWTERITSLFWANTISILPGHKLIRSLKNVISTIISPNSQMRSWGRRKETYFAQSHPAGDCQRQDLDPGGWTHARTQALILHSTDVHRKSREVSEMGAEGLRWLHWLLFWGEGREAMS